jgi:hypothetical protein
MFVYRPQMLRWQLQYAANAMLQIIAPPEFRAQYLDFAATGSRTVR